MSGYMDACMSTPGCANWPGGAFNRSGRAFPDLAAIGQNVPAFFNDSLSMVGGTSAAAPIAAGVLAMLNAELIDVRVSATCLAMCSWVK